MSLFNLVSSHDGEGWIRALQEANMAAETGLIVLDIICCICKHFDDLVKSEGELLQQIFSIYMLFLQLGQSESLMKHVFAALRVFINKNPQVLFQGMWNCVSFSKKH